MLLRLAMICLLFALIAAFLGFGVASAYSWQAAKVLAFVFLALAGLAFLAGLYRRQSYWE